MSDIHTEVIHLARLALAGREQDVQMFLRRLVKGLRKDRPDVAGEIEKLIAQSPTRSSPLRDAEPAIPVDAESRLNLVRTECPVELDCDPIWAIEVGDALGQVVSERRRERELIDEGLFPTKSLLFVGDPGVGKSLAAKWIARELNRPLVTLDLSAVMSSFLGRTGQNLRYVLDYAKTLDCVLLLDELDAVAKRRDDDAEIGELKRLVTVLLQEIDTWPPSGLLIAATNHPELLDPAAWRRFERVVNFPMPNQDQVRQAVRNVLGPKRISDELIEVAAATLGGKSFCDIDRTLRQLHREAVVAKDPLESHLKKSIQGELPKMPLDKRKAAATNLLSIGMSDRAVHDMTRLHRTVIAKLRKALA